MLSVSVWCGGEALGGRSLVGEGGRWGVGVHPMLHSAVVGLASMVFQEMCVSDQIVDLLATVCCWWRLYYYLALLFEFR